MADQLEKVQRIVEENGCDPRHLIAILQGIQAENNYLSEEALRLVAEKLGVSIAKVYSVATFYENFSLEAKGRHIIKVCAGTACHVRKSGPIYDAVYDYLGLSGKKKTSDDGLFTLETVACLGACGLAPVMTIDGEVHAKMTPEAALAILEELRRRRRKRHDTGKIDAGQLPCVSGKRKERAEAERAGAVRADLRRYGLHCRRRNEDLRKLQSGMSKPQPAGLCGAEARQR